MEAFSTLLALCDGGENAPGIPSACSTHSFMYLVKGPFNGILEIVITAIAEAANDVWPIILPQSNH